MDSYLKKYVGKQVVVYLSPWMKLFGIGFVGLMSECRDGWIELKKRTKIQHINVEKIYCFKVLE
ncbi:MAG TPA: hypothetical protein PK033_07305 [Acetivibrio sp.]|nr:hypothetical protein [Clostridium sp.]HOQ36738.1 hypothetical protein [Acetivibrio sp.]HPT91686.1 hypothetical protein [Acetivibrio sp.]HQA57670.1 hypothetical protein [Acetivibrio sp.]